MKSYFIGTHDLGTCPDILLLIEHKRVSYEIPFTSRTYSEISREKFLKLADGSLEIRNVKQ